MHPKYTYQQGLQQGGQKGLQQRRRVQQRHAGGLGRFRHRSPVGRALQGEKTFDAVGGVPDLFPKNIENKVRSGHTCVVKHPRKKIDRFNATR
jgi:hypothetical protein